jgi:hypothetical protein
MDGTRKTALIRSNSIILKLGRPKGRPNNFIIFKYDFNYSES